MASAVAGSETAGVLGAVGWVFVSNGKDTPCQRRDSGLVALFSVFFLLGGLGGMGIINLVPPEGIEPSSRA